MNSTHRQGREPLCLQCDLVHRAVKHLKERARSQGDRWSSLHINEITRSAVSDVSMRRVAFISERGKLALWDGSTLQVIPVTPVGSVRGSSWKLGS